MINATNMYVFHLSHHRFSLVNSLHIESLKVTDFFPSSECHVTKGYARVVLYNELGMFSQTIQWWLPAPPMSRSVAVEESVTDTRKEVGGRQLGSRVDRRIENGVTYSLPEKHDTMAQHVQTQTQQLSAAQPGFCDIWVKIQTTSSLQLLAGKPRKISETN